MIVSNACSQCLNYVKGRQCLAFPTQIPESIWMGQNDHRESYPGDNGIQFEPLDEADTEQDT